MSQARAIPSSAYINNSINWGVIAAAGDFIRYLYGLTSTSFFESTFRTHLQHFSPNGMYKDPVSPVENPSMTYDLFPRVYLEDVLRRGYNGLYLSNLTDVLEKGALSSLLLQSPNGELPTGGRSSQHQWNEAIQLFLYELRANKYKQAGDMVMASAFKRGARLALKSIRRWIHPYGYLYVVKNRMSLADKFGYEIYSHLTNYNGLPACFMAMAYNIADDTIPEGPSFAETGGFVFETPSHHKIVANIKGNYYEWETQAQPDYDATGLTRIQHPNTFTLIGPNAATNQSKGALNIGLAWTKGNIKESLGQFGTGKLLDYAQLNVTSVSPSSLEFSITYRINASIAGVTDIVEKIVLTENKGTISTTLNGTVDNVQFRFPIWMTDGVYNSSFTIYGNEVTIDGGISQTYSVDSPAGVALEFNSTELPMRNGWLASAVATVAPTNEYVFSIEHAKGALPTSTYTVGPSAEFTSISAALSAVQAQTIESNFEIEIESGTYSEKVVVASSNVVLRAKTSPVVVSHLSTSDDDATLTITGSNVRVYDITFVNTRSASAGIGNALRIDPSSSSQSSFYDSAFIGFKNTIVFANSLVTAYFKNCNIEGGNDVIVGSGTAYFYESTLVSNGPGSITAMSGVSATNTDQWIFYYVTLVARAPSALIAQYASNTSYTTTSIVTGHNVLGRSGDSFSRVTFMFSTLNSHINAAGWADAGHQFNEFQNRGPSSFNSRRIPAANHLTGLQASPLTLENTFGASSVIMPQWIDREEYPQCGYIYSYCGNNGFFDNPNCCRPGLSCVQESPEVSRCLNLSLSSRTDGIARVHQSATFGLSVIYISNALGAVTVSYNSSNLNAYFDVTHSNAIVESVFLLANPIPSEYSLNTSVVYPLGDPRGVTLDLHITLPTQNPIKVVVLTPNSSPNNPTFPPSTSNSNVFPPDWFISSSSSLSFSLLQFLSCVVAVAALFL